jgi:hypothetical protein
VKPQPLTIVGRFVDRAESLARERELRAVKSVAGIVLLTGEGVRLDGTEASGDEL